MEVVNIYETCNYEQFKRLGGNRDVKCVNKIIESINAVGYVLSPIMVNENFEVIDGQNRLEALKTLKLPVHYFIVKNAGIEEARSLNIGRTNWSPADYWRSFAETGNDNYTRALMLCKKYKLAPGEVYAIIKNKAIASGGLTRESYDGSLTFSEKEYLKVCGVLDVVSELLPVIDKMEGSHRVATTGTAWALRLPKVSATHLVQAFKKNYPLFRPVCTVQTFLSDLEDVYNKRTKNKIYFTTEYKKTKEAEK